MQNEERDILTLTDDDGAELELEVLRYFFYNGEEYAMVTELSDEDDGCEHDHQCDECGEDECDCGGLEVFFMKVDAVDEENEEFSFVDEELSAELLKIVEADFDEEDGCECGCEECECGCGHEHEGEEK